MSVLGVSLDKEVESSKISTRSLYFRCCKENDSSRGTVVLNCCLLA